MMPSPASPPFPNASPANLCVRPPPSQEAVPDCHVNVSRKVTQPGDGLCFCTFVRPEGVLKCVLFYSPMSLMLVPQWVALEG